MNYCHKEALSLLTVTIVGSIVATSGSNVTSGAAGSTGLSPLWQHWRRYI
jgi:hypothetical protein